MFSVIKSPALAGLLYLYLITNLFFLSRFIICHIIKRNNYLKYRDIGTFDELVKEVDRSVYLYNYEKPHIKLQRKTPIEFENDYICCGQKTDGEKSATELKTQHWGYNSPKGCGQKTSGSNIAPELKKEIAISE